MHVGIKHNNIFAGLQVGALALLAALPQMYTDQAGIGKFPGFKITALEGYADVCQWRPVAKPVLGSAIAPIEQSIVLIDRYLTQLDVNENVRSPSISLTCCLFCI
jgi:hypothetical protein